MRKALGLSLSSPFTHSGNVGGRERGGDHLTPPALVLSSLKPGGWWALHKVFREETLASIRPGSQCREETHMPSAPCSPHSEGASVFLHHRSRQRQSPPLELSALHAPPEIRPQLRGLSVFEQPRGVPSRMPIPSLSPLLPYYHTVHSLRRVPPTSLLSQSLSVTPTSVPEFLHS